MLSVNYAECRKQAHYAECHYAECRHAECRGAVAGASATKCRKRQRSLRLLSLQRLEWSFPFLRQNFFRPK